MTYFLWLYVLPFVLCLLIAGYFFWFTKRSKTDELSVQVSLMAAFIPVANIWWSVQGILISLGKFFKVPEPKKSSTLDKIDEWFWTILIACAILLVAGTDWSSTKWQHLKQKFTN